jgi:heavy metal sensor kinase
MRPHVPGRKITRGLRFRLTISYAIFFTILLALIGFLFRQTLIESLDSQLREVLEQEWAAVKGYLRIEKNQPIWFYDSKDPDEAFIVGRLQRVYLLTDEHGNVLESSDTYRGIGIDPPGEITRVIQEQKPAWRTRFNSQGAPFLIRSGVVYDETHKNPYFVAIGRPLTENIKLIQHFTFIYVSFIPLMIFGGSLLGWFLAGRALTPVISVAQAAQRITGSNLSLRIPTRRAGDELDYLIDTFNQMITRLESSFQQIRQFSTDVSHELRTPITAIRGQLEVALFTAATPEQYREAMLNALQDIERLSQIVRALLLLSQAESGQLALQKNALNLSEVAADIVDQFQIVADAEGVRLKSALEPEACVHADRIQIERMVSNLLSNAVKFTPPGGEVEVNVARRDDMVELVVADTGRGISPEHLPHIFDRFYRVPGGMTEPMREPGLGLGLSFVAWIAKAHDGILDVHSELGKGTRFTISFPAVPPSRLPSAAPSEQVSAPR